MLKRADRITTEAGRLESMLSEQQRTQLKSDLLKSIDKPHVEPDEAIREAVMVLAARNLEPLSLDEPSYQYNTSDDIFNGARSILQDDRTYRTAVSRVTMMRDRNASTPCKG